MKNTNKKCKRFGAVLLCLVMLCGTLLGAMGWTIAAAEKETFAVNFSELAALVDDDGGIFADGLYQSQADDAEINAWVDARFDRYVSRESWGYYPQTYLGEKRDVSSGEGSFWRIGEDGYLHLSTPGGGEFIRTAELLTLQYEGQPVMMDNFEATVVFKYTANRRSAVMVSFNEETPGKIGWSSQLNQDIVMFATPEEKATVAGQSGIAFSAYGENYKTAVGNFADINATAQNAFTDALVIGNDYELTVKVVGKDVTVSAKDLTADKTLLAPTTYAGKVKGDTGYLSIGAGHSARAIKSIEVKELDESGNQVDFGTLSDQDLPQKFNVKFSELADLVDDANYTDGVYTPASSDSAVNDWVMDKFDLKISREGHTFLDRTDLGTPYNNGKGNSYWSVAQNGYLVSSNQGGGEPVRTVQTLTVKGNNGNFAVLDNFEAKVVFQNTVDERGYVFVLFNEANPGKFGWRSDWGNVNQDGVFVGMTEHTNHHADYSGITVKGFGESFSPNCNDGYMYKTQESFAADKKLTAGATAVDHEMIVKVVGTDVYVKVSTPSTGAVLWEKTYEDAVKGTDGAVSIGAGRGARAIKSIEIKELDENGTWVDFGTYYKKLNPSVEAEQFVVDFSELADMVTTFTDGKYAPTANDTEINSWLDARFDAYYNRENRIYQLRTSYGEKINVGMTNRDSYWAITEDGGMRGGLDTSAYGDYVRTTEVLNVLYNGEAAIMDNFEATVEFEHATTTRGAVGVLFNEKTPGKFGWADAEYVNQDAVLVVVPESLTGSAGRTGLLVKGAGETFTTALGSETYSSNLDEVFRSTTVAANTEYQLKVRVVGNDVTVKLVNMDNNAVVLAQKTYRNAVKGTDGYISFVAGQSAQNIKKLTITELDKNGEPVDFGTYTAEKNRPEYFKADFSELSALVADSAFQNDEYTPASDDTAINEWISERFAGYYNRECWGYTARTWLGDKLDTGNASHPSYWSITKDGALKTSINAWLGGAYPRTTESLNVKYNGAALKMDNFEAKVVFSTINQRGAVYVSFNEATPGKFGWTKNPTNTEDNSYLLQDAVLIGTPETLTHGSNFSGITVKGYGESFNEYAMEDEKFTLEADVDYEMTVTVIDNDVAVKLVKVSDGTVVHTKTYTDQVLGTDGYLSIGAGQSVRYIKDIEITELDENGDPIAFGTYGSTYKESDGMYVDFKSLAAVVDPGKYVNGLYQSKEDDTDINAWIASRFGLFYSRESWGFYDRAYLGQSSAELDGGDGWGGNHYWEINKLGYLQHSTEKIGGEYLRKGDALYVKHNGLAHEMKNLEATLEFNTLSNAKGSVYIAFHEAEAGKFGWCANPRNTPDTSPMMQDAVIIGVDGEGDTGVMIKKRGVAIHGTNMGEDTFEMDANTDYKLHIRVVGKNVDVTVTKGNTQVFKKTYNNAVSSEAGYVSFGTTNAPRAFKSIEVVQLDDAGEVVEFGTSLLEAVNPDNTVRYTYNSDADLEDITSYFMPIPGKSEKAVKTEDTENDNWYVKNGSLMYKANSLAKTEQQISEAGGNPWNSNMGIAMLNTSEYKNFILDVDFNVSGRWAVFGFGAKGGEGGAFSSQKDGGYTVHIESSGGRAEVKLTGWDSSTNASIKHFSTFLSPYSGSGKHHMRLIVKQGVATVYLDDIVPLTIDLPRSYNGGYIYLGSNSTVTSYDNLTVLNLDKGPFEIATLKPGATDPIVLNRDQGDLMDVDAMPTVITGYDANGYAYTFPADWVNNEYRSYKAGSYDFKLVPALPEFKLAQSLDATKTVTNNINNDFDTETTMKYYFDHTNDFLDFVTGYDDTSKGGHSTTDDDEYKLASSPLEKWKLTGTGAITNSYTSVGYGHNGQTAGWDVSTLIRKDLNLTNYRLELDFTHGTNFWYQYVITGMQDFTAYKGEKGGVYFFVEQEGRPNVTNNLRAGTRQYTGPITDDNTFFDSYDRSMTTVHHVVIEVIDGVFTFQVDNSDAFPHYMNDTALGGFFGIAGMGNGSTFSNITITALDEDGNVVPLATADRSMASDVVGYEDTFVGWKPSSNDWKFEWNKNYIFEF